jgi:hypothetical protein
VKTWTTTTRRHPDRWRDRQLKDSTGTVVQTTTTDANGNYTFNNVPAGTYTVVETNKPGYLDVSDIDGGNPNSITVTLPAGTSSTGNDFVDERTAAIGDKVWLDKNANGVQDAGEAGIAGVTVKLLDSTGTVVGTTTTDANGNYQFSNLTRVTMPYRSPHRRATLSARRTRAATTPPTATSIRPPARPSTPPSAPVKPIRPGMPACIRRLPSATRCGWIPTRTVFRTRAKPVSPASP